MGKETQPLIITKNDFSTWAKWGNNQKREWFHTGSFECLRELTWRKNGVANIQTWKHGRMAYVFGFLLAQGLKMCFPKTDHISNSNLGCHTLPIPCNNQLNQFLAVINDWVSKTRKVVDSLVGFPFNIWIFHIDPKGLNSSNPYP